MVAQFAAHGISKRVLWTEYLMIEVPPILTRWRREKTRDQLMLFHLRNLPQWQDAQQRDKYLDSLYIQAYGEAQKQPDDEPDFSALAALAARIGGSA